MSLSSDQQRGPGDDSRQDPRAARTPHQPRVSVVVPVYNAGDSLTIAIQSVLNQSLTDLEVVIVDDGSTDDSYEVSSRLAEQDDRVRVFRHPSNRGQAAARNLALDKARGVWAALLDADDEIAPDRLRILSDVGDSEQADLIADGVEFVGPRQQGTPALLRAASGAVQILTLQALIESDIPLNGLCSFGYLKPLMRRSFLEHWRLRYDEHLRFAEDLNLYVRALMCGARFVLHPRSYYVYNQTPVSASRNVAALPEVADHALVNNHRIRDLARRWGMHDLDDLLDEHEQRWATVLWFNRLKLAVRNGRFNDLMQLTLDCPSGPRGMLRFARDRARVKRARSAAPPRAATSAGRHNGSMRT